MLRMFVPITKVDEEKRLVWGRLAHETPDRAGEIFDYESSKPHFKAWSDGFAKTTTAAGQEVSYGNLRAMHGRVAAGKFAQVIFNDADKAVDVAAKVVDDNEWTKCLEGVYTGFSIGGDYVGEKKAEKVNGKTYQRYTAKPAEGSLVDSPCIPTAKFFEISKADGSLVKVAFAAAAKSEADVVADHNSRIEKLARKIARQEFRKQPKAAQAAVPEEVFAKLDEPEQKRLIAKRPADDLWQNHVLEAIRLMKQDDYTAEEDLEKPDEVDQDEWDDMTYEEKLDAIDEYEKMVAAAVKKAADEKGLVKPSDVEQKDWDEMTGAQKKQRVEDAAAAAAKASKSDALAKAEAAEIEKEDKTPAEKPAAEIEADAVAAAKAAGASEQTISAVDELAKMLSDGTLTPEQLLGLAKRDVNKDDAVKAAAVVDDGKKEPAATPSADVKKGTWNVASFASALQSLAAVCYSAQADFDVEKDDGPVPKQLRGWVTDGVAIFKGMSDEESSTIVEDLRERGKVDVMSMATLASAHKVSALRKQLEDPEIKLSDFRKLAVEAVGEDEWKNGGYFQKYVEDQAECIESILAKAGARNSAADLEHLQSAHDHLASMGAKCSKDNLPAEEAEKVSDNGALFKMAMQATEKYATLEKAFGDLQVEVKALKDQPVAPKGKIRFIAKGQDEPVNDASGTDVTKVDTAETQPGVHDEAAAIALVRKQVVGTSAFRKF